MADLVSIIVVSSPVACHPSSELLDRLLYSLRLLRGATGVIAVQIVCDGVAPNSRKTKRQASLSQERISAYEEYKATLVRRWGRTCQHCGCRCICGERRSPRVAGTGAGLLLGHLDIQVTELDGWHGFGWGLRHALTLVRTPYVLVLPHDMELEHAIDVAELCAILADQTNRVEYIGFANPSVLNYPERVQQKSGIRLVPQLFLPATPDTSGLPRSSRGVEDSTTSLVPQPGTPLLPLLRWKENPHLTSVAQYDAVVFGPTAWPRVKRGQFLEETIGQRQNDLILRSGPDGWKEEHSLWGTYLYWPPACASGAPTSDATLIDAATAPPRQSLTGAVPSDGGDASAAAAEHHHVGCQLTQPLGNALSGDGGRSGSDRGSGGGGRTAYATFAITHHLDGNTYRTVEERLSLGHRPHAFEIERSEAAARLFMHATTPGQPPADPYIAPSGQPPADPYMAPTGQPQANPPSAAPHAPASSPPPSPPPSPSATTATTSASADEVPAVAASEPPAADTERETEAKRGWGWVGETSIAGGKLPEELSAAFSAFAWCLLGGTFAFAIAQGADFASSRETATAWGAVVGLGAFCAWLSVDLDETLDERDGEGGYPVDEAERTSGQERAVATPTAPDPRSQKPPGKTD